MTHATTPEPATNSREAIRMYPNGGLGEQYRELPDTFFGYKLLTEKFGKHV